ncbi:MAG: hypothetical protein L0Y66_26060 [Myxococcaceae bacterium]|nr:hypothetical protein [Myxococcaceae bacterium]MCI0673966.1 hypothetical protein [Myxococcaceae bacterium]
MNLRPLVTFLTLCSLATGCVYVDNDPGPGPGPGGSLPGDVAFTWTLDGMTCSQALDVASVRISIPGESIANGGVFGCSSNGVMGIVLHDFRPGSYSFTIEAWDRYGETLYARNGTFHVNGDVSVHVELQSVRPTVDLTWGLPANADFPHPTCAQAGVQYVSVQINGVAQRAYINGEPVQILVDGQWRDVVPCEWGQTGPGFRVALPSSGQHEIYLAAVSEDGFRYYDYFGYVNGFTDQTVSADYSLLWAVGGRTVQWQLYNGVQAVTCGQAGVSQVWVYFWNTQTGAYEYEPGYGQPWDCSRDDAFVYLPPGHYQVDVFDRPRDVPLGSGSYSSSYQNPEDITVAAGVFPALPLEVPVYRNP